jgi:hypothetical protein
MTEHFDVLIVGAGLSGIGAAHHLQAALPGKSYVILEARDVIGGTWDLFRYPGVRSDSDMYTLKADLVSEFVCRLLGYMDGRGYHRCVPVNDDPGVTPRPLLDFSSGYVLRSIGEFPRAGSRRPWRLGMSYLHDLLSLRYGRVHDGSLRFSGRPGQVGDRAVPETADAE